MDISSSALSSAHKQLMSLAKQLATSKSGLSNSLVAAETAHLALLVVKLLSMGVQTIPDDVLEPVARLVTLCPQLQPLRKAFCKLVAIHYFHGKLTAHLYMTLRQPEGFLVPEWWPAAREQIPHTALLWTTLMTIDYQDPSDAWLVCDIIDVVVKLLNIFERMHSNRGSLLLGLKEMSLILCLGNANRELVVLLLSHDKKVAELLQSVASDKLQNVAAAHARMILDNVLLMASVIRACSAIFDLAGAKSLSLNCGNLERELFHVAENNPFMLIIDVLNQGPKFNFQQNPRLIPAIATAAYVVDDLYAFKTELYSQFNSCSQTSSLLLVLTDFGYTIARNLFLRNSEAAQLLKPIHKLFTHWEFPPLPKPNYFFDSNDKGKDSQPSGMEQFEDLKDMNNGLLVILKIIGKTLEQEISVLEIIYESEGLLEKIIVSKVEHLLGFLIAALISGSKFDFGPQDPKLKYALVVSIIKTLVGSIENKALVWITLFNFANDTCYTDVRLVNIFENLFEVLVDEIEVNMDRRMFESGASQFFLTFNDGSADYPNITKAIRFEYPDPANVSVSDKEYKHLYEKPINVKEIEQDGQEKSKPATMSHVSNLSNSSRQQSIHVDKYGR